MTDCADIAVAVLAAGRSSRFGSDKLVADLNGLPLGIHIVRTLASLPFGWRFAVCSKTAAITQHYARENLTPIDNDAPQKGQSHSLHLAVHAAQATNASALLIVLADMPFVSAAHLAALAAQSEMSASTDGDKPMPPALFPRSRWPALLKTKGDSGARHLLASAQLIAAPPSQLRDVDVAADLRGSNL